jgi:DNA gyrase subunit B
VVVGGHEEWFWTQDEVDEFRRREQEKLGRELLVDDEAPARAGNGNGNGHGATIAVQDLHEVRELNRGVEELRRQGLVAADLLPAPRIAGREPPPRFVLENGDLKRVLPHLRDLVPEVRKLGERGRTITRFKGLGEMDAEELWETTLDPQQRTLLRVQLDDAFKADELFRTLMGEKVEPRREFIQKHALEVKDIDYHGA